MAQLPIISSTFGLLDVKRGRAALVRRLADGPIPVTIQAFITKDWGRDDGVSMEFELEVTSVTEREVPLNLGVFASLEDEARQFLQQNLKDEDTLADPETVAAAVALSTAVSLKRLADSLRHFERNGFVTRTR